MAGRADAIKGLLRKDNPYTTGSDEAQYWEYGWIEENFVEEIEEHRAVMQWTGEQLFIISEKLKRNDPADDITNDINTIAGKLAEKLQGL
jgi:NAD-dependent DNA ligase